MSGQSKEFICEECGGTLTTKQHLFEHKSKHMGNSVKCMLCGKQFGRQAYLTKHMRRTHQETTMHEEVLLSRARRYLCDHCSNRCGTKQAMLTHLFSHYEIRKYTCQVCIFSFKTKANIKRHVTKQVRLKNARNLM